MSSETVFSPDVDVISPALDVFKPALIFPENLGNLSEITNVLLISSEISDYNVFYDSVNSNTLPIVYHPFASTEDEVSAVLSRFSSIQRIGIAFHSSSGAEKMFLDRKSLFTNSDITESGNYSENLTWLLQVIRHYNVQNIDFLACNSLNFPNWVSYFDLLHKETGVIVGASNDKTGNIKYGGDWIMESTGEDVELVYFTSSIEYYKYLLYNINVNGINYDVNDATLLATVSQNPGLTGDIVIPSTIFYNTKTYNVNNIAGNAFNNNCPNLTSMSLPNSVTSIEGGAFYKCTSLISISFSNTLTSIGGSAFRFCSSLISVSLPNSLTSLGNLAFANDTSLTSVLFPNSLTSLGILSFYECGIKTGLFNYSIRLPVLDNVFTVQNASTAYYNLGVLPPEGQGTDPAVYLKQNRFTYAIAVGPTNLTLSNITLNGTTVLSGSTTLVKNTVETAIVTATAQDPTCTATVTGNPVLMLGVNRFTITVTAIFGDTATYFINVLRLEPNCFLEGTKILCLVDNEEKYIPIETMRNGTLVKTLASGYKQLQLIGHSTIYNPGNNLRFKDRLFKCSKSAYPELTEDLILTGCHSILVGYLTEEQRKLSIELTRDVYVTEDRYRLIACLDDKAQPYEEEGVYKIWHIALENPNIFENYGIFANGLLVESMSIRMMINFSGKELVL